MLLVTSIGRDLRLSYLPVVSVIVHEVKILFIIVRGESINRTEQFIRHIRIVDVLIVVPLNEDAVKSVVWACEASKIVGVKIIVALTKFDLRGVCTLSSSRWESLLGLYTIAAFT